ncbi:hypothetical protein Rhal01_01574 [Rubritalea halochordaticola]|uniref:Helicase n=1 Tax=Rubritalea halochordaticola TaxID=714537 RepID=A0ABP9V0D4_9BACT
MNIDEKWVGQAAGWKALKGGRDLFKRGVVVKAEQRGPLVTGEIAGGAKPLRVTVRILSETDVETVCPRPACRRTGVICEHAVAVMLGVIHGVGEVSESSDRGRSGSAASEKALVENALAIRVDLPPQFPKGLPEGGLSLRMSKVEEEAKAWDGPLTEWVEKQAGGKVPPMAGLRGKQALDFLKVLDGHRRVFAGEDEVRISTSGVPIPMHIALDEDRVELGICSSVLEHGEVWYAHGELWLWDRDQHVMAVVDVSGVLADRQWQRLGQGLPVFVPMKSFMKELAQWSSLAVWDDDSVLGEVPVKVGTPEFHLVLDGSTQMLQAKLTAKYAMGVELRLGLFQGEEMAFPVEDPKREGHWIERNREAEDEAAGVLMRYGFQIVDSEGGWQLGGDDAVIDFLTDALPKLEQDWTVRTGGKLGALKGNLVRVRPNIEVSGSGEDWLAFDYGFQTDAGQEIPKEAIRKMLAAGKKTARTKNGKQVVISSFDAEMVESVLRDTDPRQEGGKFYVPQNQGAFLRRVRDYYRSEQAPMPDRSVLENLPETIRPVLRGYQEDGIAWLSERVEQEGAALLADDMGLGKTLQTLSLLHLRKGKPSLVVCPTSLLGSWADEAAKWVPGMNVLVMHGPGRKDYFEVMHSADIIITSYALIARDLKKYRDLELGIVVLDEASVIRNPDTQAAKALRQLQSEARVALSGTPVENAVRDLWSLYAFLLPGYLGSREDFKNRYEGPLSGNRPDEHIMRRLRMRVEPFMIRRTKTQVAKDLPGKMEQILWCEPSDMQKKAYQEVHRMGVSQVDELEGGRARMQMLTVLLRLRQASCDLRLLGMDGVEDKALSEVSSKLEMLVELLQEAKRGGHRVLVFSQFTKMLGLAKQALDAEGISYAYLDGSTRDRAGEVKKFQQEGGPDAFLISLKAGGYGLNLTAADTVVHFDPWWNPAVEAQATDRAYRIGQTRPVTVYKLIAKGTVEEKILKLQQRKKGLIGAAIGDEDQPMMSGISAEEMRDLLG